MKTELKAGKMDLLLDVGRDFTKLEFCPSCKRPFAEIRRALLGDDDRAFENARVWVLYKCTGCNIKFAGRHNPVVT